MRCKLIGDDRLLFYSLALCERNGAKVPNTAVHISIELRVDIAVIVVGNDSPRNNVLVKCVGLIGIAEVVGVALDTESVTVIDLLEGERTVRKNGRCLSCPVLAV